MGGATKTRNSYLIISIYYFTPHNIFHPKFPSVENGKLIIISNPFQPTTTSKNDNREPTLYCTICSEYRATGLDPTAET